MSKTEAKQKPIDLLNPKDSAFRNVEDPEKIDNFLVIEYDDKEGTGKGYMTPSPKQILKTKDIRERYKGALDRLSATQFEEFKALIQASPLADVFGGAAQNEAVSVVLPTVAPQLWADCRADYPGTPVDFVREKYSLWIGAIGFDRSHLSQLDSKLAKAYAQRVKNYPNEELGIPKRTYAPRKDAKVQDGPQLSEHVPIDQLPPAQQEARRIASAERSARYRQNKQASKPL